MVSSTIFTVALVFLSTLSLRRATPGLVRVNPTSKNFYPRSPYGERPQQTAYFFYVQSISIHALLTESDQTFNIERIK